MTRKRLAALAAFVLVLLCLALVRPRNMDLSRATASTPSSEPAKREEVVSVQLFGGGGSGPAVDVQAATKGRVAETVTAPGTIRPGSEVSVGAPFEGRILKLCVDEGDRVKVGDVIFELDPVEWREKRQEAELELTRRKAALAEAESDASEADRKQVDLQREPSALTEARLRRRQSELGAERSKAQLESSVARLNLARAKLEMNVGSKVDVDAAETEKHVSAIAQRIAEEELRLAVETESFRERTWKEDRASAKKTLENSQTRLVRATADLNAAEVALKRAMRDLERTKITTPLAGVVTARQVNQGELVNREYNRNPDQSHYIVSDMAHVLVYCDVEEGDVTKVVPEQPARVRVNALGDDVRLKGKVLDVANRAGRRDDVATFRVRILLDSTEGDAEAQKHFVRLRPSMTASVEIETRSKEEAVRVPKPSVGRRKKKDLPDAAWSGIDAKTRDAKKPEDQQDVVFIVKDGKAEIRAVVVGVSDVEDVEIEKGVALGEPVIVGPYRVLETLRQGDAVRAREMKPGEKK